MWKRATRPQGEPEDIETQMKRLTPVLGQNLANVYTMPEDENGTARYVGSYDVRFCADELRQFQDNGYLVYS